MPHCQNGLFVLKTYPLAGMIKRGSMRFRKSSRVCLSLLYTRFTTTLHALRYFLAYALLCLIPIHGRACCFFVWPGLSLCGSSFLFLDRLTARQGKSESFGEITNRFSNIGKPKENQRKINKSIVYNCLIYNHLTLYSKVILYKNCSK